MWKEFKEFAMGGNVLDLAVGLVIGAAFGKLPTSFVDNIVMPFVNAIVPGGSFKGLATGPLNPNAPDSSIKYGLFIDDVIAFMITAFAIFLVVKQINKWRNTSA